MVQHAVDVIEDVPLADPAIAIVLAEVLQRPVSDILPPVRLYSMRDIKDMYQSHGVEIDSFTGVRHLTIYQEPLKGIGTTETDRLMYGNPDAMAVEELLMESGELLCMARFFLVTGSVQRSV